MLAREYCDHINRKLKPIILSHHMLYGLKAGQVAGPVPGAPIPCRVGYPRGPPLLISSRCSALTRLDCPPRRARRRGPSAAPMIPPSHRIIADGARLPSCRREGGAPKTASGQPGLFVCCLFVRSFVCLFAAGEDVEVGPGLGDIHGGRCSRCGAEAHAGALSCTHAHAHTHASTTLPTHPSRPPAHPPTHPHTHTCLRAQTM